VAAYLQIVITRKINNLQVWPNALSNNPIFTPSGSVLRIQTTQQIPSKNSYLMFKLPTELAFKLKRKTSALVNCRMYAICGGKGLLRCLDIRVFIRVSVPWLINVLFQILVRVSCSKNVRNSGSKGLLRCIFEREVVVR